MKMLTRRFVMVSLLFAIPGLTQELKIPDDPPTVCSQAATMILHRNEISGDASGGKKCRHAEIAFFGQFNLFFPQFIHVGLTYHAGGKYF
jgi:hypothetical protein